MIFLLGTLAMNQTVFFEAVGDALEDAGHKVRYLCFHERSHEYLQRRGKVTYNAFSFGEGDEHVDLSSYSWPSLNLVLSHEKAAFEVTDTQVLLRKLRRYLAASEAVLGELAGESSEITLVQELGGFLSNMATFYAARRRNLDNIFIEPSFFRGRVAFLCNSFAAPSVTGPRSGRIGEEAKTYLDDAIARQRVVIPVKDARHYRGPLRKLTDPYNIRRLMQKAVDAYLLGKREEFGHVAGHVARHVRMWRTSRALARHYSPLPAPGKRFVYYPLHVPADVALTIRSPQYVDQIALIDFISRVVPETHEVAIKEHPALVGATNRRRMQNLLATRDNVRLLNPEINNYEVLARADAVVTVNSKSGAEALLLGRPVVVLGDAFYSRCDLVCRVQSLETLPEALLQLLKRTSEIDIEAVRRYFQDIWDATWPGELHVQGKENARQFADSLLRYLGNS